MKKKYKYPVTYYATMEEVPADYDRQIIISGSEGDKHIVFLYKEGDQKRNDRQAEVDMVEAWGIDKDRKWREQNL